MLTDEAPLKMRAEAERLKAAGVDPQKAVAIVKGQAGGKARMALDGHTQEGTSIAAQKMACVLMDKRMQAEAEELEAAGMSRQKATATVRGRADAAGQVKKALEERPFRFEVWERKRAARPGSWAGSSPWDSSR